MRDDPRLNRKGMPYPQLAIDGMATLGQSVRRARLRAGYSQTDLELRCGLDQTVISRIENGKLPSLAWWRFAQLVGALGPAWDPPPEPPRTVTVEFVDWSSP